MNTTNGAKIYRDAYEEAAAKYSKAYDEAAAKFGRVYDQHMPTLEDRVAKDDKVTKAVIQTDPLEEGFSLVDPKGLQMDMTNTKAIEAKKNYATKVVTTLATTAGTGAAKVGLGAQVVSHTAGAYLYSAKIAELGMFGTTRVGQYIAANAVGSATAALVATPVVAGISVGAVATGFAAVAASYTFLKVGGFIYNNVVAKTNDEQITTEIAPIIKNSFWS